VLCLENLTLENNIEVIFKNLNVTFLPGSLAIIQGANGSGKTCLLRMITGRIRPTSGKISWNNINIDKDIGAFNSNISYIGHNNSLKLEQTTLENLDFWCKFRGSEKLLVPAITCFRLEHILNATVGSLSAGWQRRVELAKLLLCDTSLWLLDEPEINLDAEAKGLLLGIIESKIRSGCIVVIASHHFNNINYANYLNIEDFKNGQMVVDC